MGCCLIIKEELVYMFTQRFETQLNTLQNQIRAEPILSIESTNNNKTEKASKEHIPEFMITSKTGKGTDLWTYTSPVKCEF